MPFYEYQCQACGAQTEALQKVSDAPLRKCPECGRQKLVKLVSAPVFRLKGGGWYETDFKGDKDAKRNLADADKEPAPAAEGDKAKDAAKESGNAEKADKAEKAVPKPVAARPRAKAKSATKAKTKTKAKSARGGAARR
jgi:putative FmdB family regulatory protein